MEITDPIHVLPVDDILEHEMSKDCICEPKVIQEDGMGVPVILHNSFDGRELIEQGLADEGIVCEIE